MRIILLLLFMLSIIPKVSQANNTAAYDKARAIYEKWIPALSLSYKDSFDRTIEYKVNNKLECETNSNECLEKNKLKTHKALDDVISLIKEESVKQKFIRAAATLDNSILDNLLNANIDNTDAKLTIYFIYDGVVAHEFLEIIKTQGK